MAAALSLGAAAVAPRSPLRPPPPIGRSWRRRSESIRANRIAATLIPGDESDPFLRSALAAASIRHRESLRPGVGAKVSRGCVLIHIPLESSNLLETFYKRGFNGGRPSIWALQGLPLSTLGSLNDLLLVISSLAMKGSILLGELPACLEGNKFEDKVAKRERLDKFFMMYGFRFSVVDYEEAAKEMHFYQDALLETSNSVLFVAEQLRLSDAQMEMWRTHFERIEEEGDEEGFEEL